MILQPESAPGKSGVGDRTPLATIHDQVDLASPGTMIEWFGRILVGDQKTEVRAFKGKANRSKLFVKNDLALMVREASKLSAEGFEVYFTINPILAEAAGPANDGAIERRTSLLIDSDPTRSPEAIKEDGVNGKVSATLDEKNHAIRQSTEIRDYLRSLGWPDPIEADSGNGYHLLYAVDLPNDNASRDIVKAALVELARRFNDANVEVDTVVFNASRICKFYGTPARKGRSTIDRPHRCSAILAIPEGYGETIVSDDQLKALGSPPVEPEQPAVIPMNLFLATAAGSDRWTPEVRAVAYLQKCDPAISGQKGHSQAFKVACTVGPGFNLHPDTAYRLLQEVWNPTCEPRWSDNELRHKIDEAYKKTTRRGWLLEVDRNGPSNARGRTTSSPGKHSGETDEQNELPEIVISTDEFRVNDDAIRSLKNDPDIFCRGNYLVTVQRDAASTKLITRPPETPRIAGMQKASIRERLTKNARWVKWKKDPKSNELIKAESHVPDWSTAAIEARGSWPGVRPLEGVTETPILLSDGSILDKPGYDERSGLLYEPNCNFPPIPSVISQADARRAAQSLLDLVADFPFAVMQSEKGDGPEHGDGGAGHRVAFLAGLLTPLARYAIAGPCPLFLATANTAASGKTKLCDTVAILATGREAARTAYPESDDEMRKQILSIALEGDRLMLIDNVPTGMAFGGASLDGVLTGTTVKGRILGRSEMTREIPIYTVWYATGNNLTLKGDALRRVVPYRLESPEERPEERKDFRIEGDYLDYVKTHRGRLVVAALTILRGYVLAGRPEADLTPMDYPAWCRVVRQAIHWGTGVDPCLTRRELIADDEETNLIRGLISGWAELPYGTTGLTTARAVRILTDPEHAEKFGTIRDVLLEWSKDGGIPSPNSIGKKLKMFKGRVLDGRCLKSVVSNGTQIWRVASTR